MTINILLIIIIVNAKVLFGRIDKIIIIDSLLSKALQFHIEYINFSI